MKNIFVLITTLLILVFTVTANCQHFNRCLEAKLSLEVKSIGFIEPIYYKFSLENISTKNLIILEPFDKFYNPVIEYKEIDSEDWKIIYNNNIIDWTGFLEAPIFNMAPGRKVEKKAYFFSYNGMKGKKDSIEYCFEEGKEYLLRGVYYTDSKKKEKIFTNEVHLKIERYEGQDVELVQWLKALPSPYFLFDFSRFTTDHKEKTLFVIEKFAESKFREWAELQLLIDEIKTRNSQYRKPTTRDEKFSVFIQEIEYLKGDILKLEDLFLRSKELQVRNIIQEKIERSKQGIAAYESFLNDLK